MNLLTVRPIDRLIFLLQKYKTKQPARRRGTTKTIIKILNLPHSQNITTPEQGPWHVSLLSRNQIWKHGPRQNFEQC